MEGQIKVFLDSNVLFSIAYTGAEKSRSYLIYEIQALGRLKVYLSSLVCEEALLNIRRKKPAAEQFLTRLIGESQVLDNIAADLQHADLRKLPQNDRIILTTAVYHSMDFFLTGNDRDFKRLYRKKVRETIVLRPVDFVNMDF